MARLVKAVKKTLARRSKRIAKLAPIDGFKSRKPIGPVIVVHLPAKKKPTTKSSKIVKKSPTTKSTPAKKSKVAKERVKKIKNEKLVPRSGLTVHEENPYFFVKNHVLPPTGTDMLDSVRYAHRLVEQKDIQGLKKLVSNADKFPQDGVHCGFSFCDRKPLILRAILKDDEKLIDAVLALEKDGEKDRHLRESLNENCILKKMTTGQQNIHMLGHRTAHIEMTRGSRQGNNALILYDSQNDEFDLPTLFNVVGDKLDFGIIQKLTSEKGLFHDYDLPVWLAIRTGNRKLAAYMIEYKAKYYFNQLHINTLKFNNQPLPKFMPISTTKKAMMNKSITPVHTAAINENVKYLKELAAVEPAINQPDLDNWYTIHYAAVCVGPDPLKYLIDHGALVTLLNKQKESPLHCAARAGRVENIKILIEAYRKMEKQMPTSDVEMDASEEEAAEVKKLKMPSGLGGYLNAKNTATMTPLHLAVSHGQHEVVELLLKEKDVHVDLATSATHEKLTPLMTAARRGDLKMVRILIDQGHAWIDQDDKFKRTALIHAVLGGHEHVVAELAKRGAGISTKPDSSQNSAVHYAAAYGWLNIVKLLEQAEPACLAEKNAWHLTPLTVAFLKNHMEIVSYLLDGNHKDVEINIDDQDNDGNSILLLVLKFENEIGSDKTLIERLNYLKEKKANVALKNSAGYTALHYFASRPLKLRGSKGYVKDSEDNKNRLKQKDYLEILDFLSQGLDSETVAIEDEDGDTALELALDKGNFLLAEKLFAANSEAAIQRWKKVPEEGGKERERTIFHRFIDAIFTMNGQANTNDYSVYEHQLGFPKFFEKILEATWKANTKNDETLAYVLASKYNVEGRTPLLHLLRRVRGLNIPVANQENGTYASLAQSLVPHLISIAKSLIKIDKELIFMRELESNTSAVQSPQPRSFGWNNSNSFQEPTKPASPFLPNAFELALVGNSHGFVHHFKLLDEDQKMHNPWIKMMVDEMDAGLFERAMLSQDERFGFKGHSPLLYGIENNHVDVVEFLLSVCEKHNLTSKICALTLEKVLGEDGTTYETVNKTALLLSIEKKQMRIAEFLVTKTNQAKNVDEQGRNAFHYLARMPNEIVEFFEMLESHGVSFITDKKGRRPLHYAVATLQAARSTDISTDNVEYLLAADPMATDVADVDSRIPLHYSFVPFEDNWKKHEEKPVEVREERTREKRRRQRRPEAAMEVDSNGNDAAASKVEKLIGFDSKKIAKSDPIPVVSLLLKQTNSKSLTLADKYGNSILHCAAAAGANICLLTLLHKMDDVNAKNFIGNTPLAIAVENGYDSAAMTLIQAGSNVADKFYGPVPKPLDENLEKWTSWPMRSEKPVQRENTILSLIVRNGWQGIIYIVLDRLTDDSEHVLIEMLAAAVEHKQLNLAHSLLKKLKKVKNLGHRTTVIFENLAKVYSASTNEVKLFEALVEAGFSWLNADGTSLAAEKFAENEQLHGLNTLKQLDGKYNNSQNWKKLLQSETRGKIMKGLLKAWNGSKPRDYLLQLMSFIQEFADKDQFAQQLFDFCKPAFPGMEKIAKKKPEAEIQKVTALIYAIQTRKYGLMEFLLGKMANVNAADENGLSPMMHAILANDETAIKILLRMKDIQYKEKDSEGNVPVLNEGEDEDGMDEDEVDGIAEEDDEESEASAEDAEESEEEVPRKRPRMLLTKKKRVSKKAVKAKKAPKKSSFSFKNSKVEIFAVDKAGNNILHYFVAPNGFENIEMAKKFIQAEPMLKTLITKPNSESDSPLATAARNKQKAMFDLFCGFLAKNQIEQRLVKLVEFPSELGKIQRLECPFDLDQESADFVQRQTDAQRIPESEEEKRRKERKPHRMVHNAETSEIVEDDSTKKLYKVLMHKTDVSFGVYGFHNYYRMQLVQRKRSSLFVLFTHWGRIGDETGQCQHTPFNDKDLAIKEFKSIFKQKSGNEWDEKFVEKHGKYKLVQVEENPVNLVELKIELEAKSDQNEKSENEKAVGKVIKDLSNVKLLKNKWSALSGSISQNLPFGRITKEKLVRAQEILEECQALEARKTSKNLAPEVSLKISEDQYSLTNEFYMQIALGSFAFGKMRILENTQTIKQMENLLKQLFEFEIAAKLVTAAAGQTDLDPFEYIEAAIETQLTILDPDSLEAQRILQCIANSSPDTKVTGIFSVLSKTCVENFDDAGRCLPNHKYLWHGTKPENLLSILKVGLLASPPHAVMSGNLYGEGLYFSDVFEKSKNYCTQSAAGQRYALLCEVALGDVHESETLYHIETTASKNMEKKHTLKIVGQNIPNDSFEITTEKGVRLPMGSIQTRASIAQYWSQYYSEYIVKDRRNVNIRYLIQFQ